MYTEMYCSHDILHDYDVIDGTVTMKTSKVFSLNGYTGD